MRHLKSGRALGVKPAHRRAMMRNLVTSLLEHEQITTTVARAKEMRAPLDNMITLGKKGDLAARRRALSFVKTKQAMRRLFDELPERYAERPGGYSRILRVGVRKGDGAQMALIQLVDAPNDALAHAEKPTARRRGGKGGKVREEVAEKVKGKDKAAAAPKTAKAEAAEPEDEKTAAKAPQTAQAEAGEAEATEEKPAESKQAESQSKKPPKTPAEQTEASSPEETKRKKAAKDKEADKD